MNIKNLIRQIKKLIKEPRWIIILLDRKGIRLLNDKNYLKMMYKCMLNKKLDLKNPKTFNEKLQWLKLYDRNPNYTILVDKYEVKKYIEKTIGKEYVIPTIGIWDNFEDINLSFEKGSLNALVGANGTGKTSILNLICGIYSNTSGTISIDSNSIEELKRDSIIQLISYVMQIPVIYRASIIENLIMPTENRMVCMDKIIFLCKSLGLYEDILNLPEGFHTYITESYKLSAGQQKKIQLVRCILRDTPILLLDEPFANLDYGTKKAVISILKEYARTHLVIIATHDQETLTEFDKIYRMEDIVGNKDNNG